MQAGSLRDKQKLRQTYTTDILSVTTLNKFYNGLFRDKEFNDFNSLVKMQRCI